MNSRMAMLTGKSIFILVVIGMCSVVRCQYYDNQWAPQQTHQQYDQWGYPTGQWVPDSQQQSGQWVPDSQQQSGQWVPDHQSQSQPQSGQWTPDHQPQSQYQTGQWIPDHQSTAPPQQPHQQNGQWGHPEQSHQQFNQWTQQSQPQQSYPPTGQWVSDHQTSAAPQQSYQQFDQWGNSQPQQSMNQWGQQPQQQPQQQQMNDWGQGHQSNGINAYDPNMATQSSDISAYDPNSAAQSNGISAYDPNMAAQSSGISAYDPNTPTQSNGQCGPNKKSVCYYTNWSGYRTGDGKYEPEDIDPKLCSHVIYAFAVIDPATGKMKMHDEWADVGKNGFEKVTALKNQGVKVSIAVGGWTDSTAQNYGQMLTDPQKRSVFAQSAKEFAKKYNFDGVDLDMEYPGCWQNNCDSSRAPAEKAGFAALTKELSALFKPEGLLLSAAVSANPKIADQAYDIPEISKNLDWINLMSYDYHGSWDSKTGHNAPFGGSDNLNVKATVDYWLQHGAPAQKLVVGMPTYGQSFTLANPQNNGFDAPTSGPGTAGEFSKAAGSLAYYEICQKAKQEGWKAVHDTEIGPYATKDNQWVSYDDVDNFRNKGKYICEKGLGGGMIWTLDFDDFKGKCGCGKYPLLTALNQEIRGVGGPQVQNCT